MVWVPLSTSQRQLYEKYLANRHVQLTLQSAQDRKCFPVEVVNNLKTISRHPFLMEASDRMREQRQRLQQPPQNHNQKHNHHAFSSASTAAASRYDDYGDIDDCDDDDGLGLDDLIGGMEGLGIGKAKKSSTDKPSSSSSSSSLIRANANVFDIVGRNPSPEGNTHHTTH